MFEIARHWSEMIYISGALSALDLASPLLWEALYTSRKSLIPTPQTWERKNGEVKLVPLAGAGLKLTP